MEIQKRLPKTKTENIRKPYSMFERSQKKSENLWNELHNAVKLETTLNSFTNTRG